MPSFSVIIPAHQAADTIGRAVASAVAQTHPPAEIIVCDDGSSDDLAAALEPWPSVILVRQDHAGVSAACNRAAAAATGDFLVKLDADDEWLPERLDAMTGLLRDHPTLDILTTDATVVRPDGTTWRYYSRKPPFPSVDDQVAAILADNFVFGSAAFRRSAFEAIGGFRTDVPYQGEYECWMRLVVAGSRVGLVERELALYHRREASWSAHARLRPATIAQTLSELARSGALAPDEARQARRRARRLRRDLFVDRLRRLAGRSAWRRRAAMATRPLRSTELHVVVTGWPRSGTSLLFNMVATADPGLRPARFETPARVAIRRRGSTVSKRPRDLFEISAIVDANVRQKRVVFVAIVRDPRDVVCSQHPNVPGTWFIGADHSHSVAGRPPYRIAADAPGLRSYARALEHLVSSDHDVVLVKYEDLVADPDRIERLIAACLGRSPASHYRDFHRDPDRHPYRYEGATAALAPELVRESDAVTTDRVGRWRTSHDRRRRVREQLDRWPELHDLSERLGYVSDRTWVDELDA